MVGLILDAAAFRLSEGNGSINEAGVARLSGSSQDQRGVCGCILKHRSVRKVAFCILKVLYLRLVDIDGYIDKVSKGCARRFIVDLHSKSPESETTTVPVCLRRSREVDMVVVVERQEMTKFYGQADRVTELLRRDAYLIKMTTRSLR